MPAHEPEIHKAAMVEFMQVIAEAAVDRLLAEQVEQHRIASGFVYFARYRLERGLVP